LFTISIIWLVLAVAVTWAASLRRSTALAVKAQQSDTPSKDSGKALTLFAAIYGVALLAGFLLLSRFLFSSL
jgi:uncharacterized membrane protein